jgi:hypothetical protein
MISDCNEGQVTQTSLNVIDLPLSELAEGAELPAEELSELSGNKEFATPIATSSLVTPRRHSRTSSLHHY